MSGGRLDHARVEIPFADGTVAVQPTLEAIKAVSRQFGGLPAALEALKKGEFDTLVFILGAGCKRADIEQAVFEAGMGPMTAAAVEYIMALHNPSGRERDESGEGKA